MRVHTTRSVAQQPHHLPHRHEAKHRLKYPPVTFTGAQARAVARGFADVAADGYRLHALAVLPEHGHVVASAGNRSPAQVIGHLKRGATDWLIPEGLHPFAQGDRTGVRRSCWASRAWKVFLDTSDDARRAIEYVRSNPLKEGKRRQEWRFLVPFE